MRIKIGLAAGRTGLLDWDPARREGERGAGREVDRRGIWVGGEEVRRGRRGEGTGRRSGRGEAVVAFVCG